jgi:V/A-type H+/Na+-transporting ATPase subunit D
VAIKVQYNKTFMQQLGRSLKVRENALPTLQAKESALRAEVKKARNVEESVEEELAHKRAALAQTHRLWGEFPHGLVRVENVDIGIHKIAGVKAPELRQVRFTVAEHSTYSQPWWFAAGIELLKEIVSLSIRKEIAAKKVEVLEYARKKTTQKVNLYEKVQIPELNEALLKIKRFLEDEENLAKSSQKILKARLAAAAQERRAA